MSPSTLAPPSKTLVQTGSVVRTVPEPPKAAEKSDFVVTPQSAPARRRLALPLLIGLAILAVAAYVVQRGADRQDPHYARAVTMIADYERGRLDSEKNYGHPVYQAALGELALVAADSESAEEAQALTQRLESLIAEWRAARETDAGARAGRDQRERSRDVAFFESQRSSRLNPVEQHPECEP